MSVPAAGAVLITGASSGIGCACAVHLARLGYRVFGTSRHPQPIAAEPGWRGSLTMIPMDVDDTDSVDAGVAAVLAQAGRLHAVVNNAGYSIGGAVETTSPEAARALFETNVLGGLRVCRAVLPTLRAQRAGYVVNMGSLAGRIGIPYQGFYSATKFALEGLSEALRMELSPWGIHVVLIEPGDSRTALTINRRWSPCEGTCSIYAAQAQRTGAVIAADEQGGFPPEWVARTLAHILVHPRPPLRYPVARFDQRLALWLKGVLPGGLFEQLILYHYGIPPNS